MKETLISVIKKLRPGWRFKVAIGLSLLFHLLLFLVHLDLFQLRPIEKPKRKAMQVTLLDKIPEDLKKIRSLKKKAALSKKKQIVNSEVKGKKMKPASDRFLGAKDQVVDRQTISKNIGSFKEAGKGKKAGSENGKKIAAQKRKNDINKISLSDLAMNDHGKKAVKRIKKTSPVDESEQLGIKFGDEKNKGLAQNSDYIEDVPLGDMTHLNTVEFKYFGFYNRIRQKLEQYWGNSLREKAKDIYRTGRKLASAENYITSIRLTLDHKGNIVNIVILGSSGISELDAAAVESFNKAGPFPNPPQGMMKNGKTTIEWGFVVKS